MKFNGTSDERLIKAGATSDAAHKGWFATKEGRRNSRRDGKRSSPRSGRDAVNEPCSPCHLLLALSRIAQTQRTALADVK